MIVVSQGQIRMLMQGIVEATHGMTDTQGERRIVSTIDSRTLESAARIALEITTGETVLIEGQKITLRRPERRGAIDVEVL